MFDECVGIGVRVVEFVRVALADQIGSDATRLARHMRDDVTPEVRRCRVAVQEHHGVAGSVVVISHLPAVDRFVLLAQWFAAHAAV